MPRDGSDVYTQPFPIVIDGTTIESAVYNGFTTDVAQDLNTPRPVVAGGTGANNADDARDNLGAEARGVQVTNYDSHVWESGSFYSAPGATGAPNGTDYFAGICYLLNNDSITVEARSQGPDGPLKKHVRQKWMTTWTAWYEVVDIGTDADVLFVNVAGDTMTGDLEIDRANPQLILNATSAAGIAAVVGAKTGISRWAMVLGNSDAEGGVSTGSNFGVGRYNNAGALLDVPLGISRETGGVSHPKGTDWGSGPMRLKYPGGVIANSLVWDKDLSGVDRVLWDSVVCPVSNTTNGYQKFASGLLMQWGVVGGSSGDTTVSFPTGFPGTVHSLVVTPIASVVATSLLSFHIATITTSNFIVQPRFANNGGVVGSATQGFNWAAWGA